MSLSPGHKLAHYEVLELIGKGGMGEVYRARDGKLGRDVAIKVLPEEFAENEERLARFKREAKVLASLNHPNIASIYGLEQSGNIHYLVLELVPGETLAQRISGGPIPLEEALDIATQMAEALEEAHEQGIVHRDLKPANVKQTEDGKIKVLDYGLAKVFQEETPEADSSMSPTLTRDANRVGVILGTAAYMSPEQAKGKKVDKRTDIFAFGAVLYEMLTGQKAFPGEDVSEVLASVIKLEPDWKALPAGVSFRLLDLLRRCLEKDSKRRVRDIGDVRLAMEGTFETTATPQGTVSQPVGWRPSIVMAVAALLALITGVAIWSLRPEVRRPVARFSLSLPSGVSMTGTGRHAVALSPDGTQLVFSANQQLYLRAMDQMEATPVRGTEGGARGPFFSHDGEWIGYEHQGQLRKVARSGGVAVTLGEAEILFGASWGEDDTILFGLGSDGIWLVPGAGGTPEQLIALNEGELAHGPQMLPGGEWVLFTLRPEGISEWDEAQIVVQSVATGERRRVIDRGRAGRYVPTGHLVYVLDAVMMAVPFDLAARAVTGGPVPLVEGVLPSFGARATGAAQFSVASTGSLVYIPGSAEGGNQFELVWVDRVGQVKPLGAEPRRYRWARVSPDGTKVAVHALGDGNADIWIYDLTRGTLTRLTFDEAFDGFPLWSPDGSRVVFQSLREGGGLFWKAADGTGEVERLLEHPNAPRPYGWSADGRLVFDQGAGVPESSAGAIGVVNLEGDRTSELVIDTGKNPAMSPDGRWIAYGSVESGGGQIYVRPFPNVNDGKWQVSTDHGFDPLWSPNGRELFFNTLAGMMVTRVETEPTFNPGMPELFPFRPGTPVGGTEFDIAPDGERFLMLEPIADESSSATQINVILNWFNELERLVPVN